MALHLLSLLRLRRLATPALTLLGLAPAVQAQIKTASTPVKSAGQLFTLEIPWSSVAQSRTGGEPVRFTGSSRIVSRLVLSPETGRHRLLANFDFNGVIGEGTQSRTRYEFRTQEAIVLPHTGTQTVGLSFPMEPRPGSPAPLPRAGLASFVFTVNLSTGEITNMKFSGLSLS